MDGTTRRLLARMPLAEATLWVWRWVADEQFLNDLFERYRGRGYTRVLTFPLLVHLIADALLQHDGSGRQSFEQARDAGDVAASVPAAYGKLRRLSLPLSQALLAECTARLRELFPQGVVHPLPSCLADFEVLVLDGKTIKGLHKRLKPLRSVAGGAVGGKALVAFALRSGLVVGLQADLDGNANEVRLVPDLLPALRAVGGGPRLWLADRAFSYAEQVERFAAQADAFLVRRRSDISFEPDRRRPSCGGRDASGRRYTQQWGWLGRSRAPRCVYVRQITLERVGEQDLVLVSSLLDERRYPAVALLDLYLCRWRIERVFQEVTEVFGLAHLIGSTPRASVFQFAFCLVLYNILQLLRAYLAAAQQRPLETISTEKLFRDVRRQLIAWAVLLGAAPTIQFLKQSVQRGQVCARLHELLRPLWHRRWLKAPRQERPAGPPGSARGKHVSAHQIIQASRAQAKPSQRKRV